MTHVTCRLTAKNRDQLRNPTLRNRVWATFIFNPQMEAADIRDDIFQRGGQLSGGRVSRFSRQSGAGGPPRTWRVVKRALRHLATD